MKTRSTIQIHFFVLLLTVVSLSTAYSQDPIPAEKKRALHRFDPSDVFPEEREATRSRGKRRQAQSSKDDSAASTPKLRSVGTATAEPNATKPARPALSAEESPAPEPPVPEVTPSIAPEATPQKNAMAVVESSNLPAAVTGDNQTSGGEGFPLYFLLPLLFLILFALIALIISLKKQLGTS
jgi:hypothetical protein